MKRIFLGLMLLFPGSSFAVSLQPVNLLSVEISATVNFDNSTGLFNYSYMVNNLSSSQENLTRFYILVPGASDKKSILGLVSPVSPHKASGIIGGNQSRGNQFGSTYIGWSIIATASSGSKNIPPVGLLSPGESQSGFGIRTANLPTIQTFYAEGWAPKATDVDLVNYFNKLTGKNYTNLEEVPDSLLAQSPLGQTIPQKSFNGKTVSPQLLLSTKLQPISLIQRLISLKEQAFHLGWIDNPGVANSLDQKLNNALKDVQKGNTNAASGILGALSNELDAQHGKHVNDNAYSLIKANVLYILNLLGN